MPAHDELSRGKCGHASCAARELGLEAQGREAFSRWRDAVRDGVPAAVYTHLAWDELSPEARQWWTDLVNYADDAFTEAWIAG